MVLTKQHILAGACCVQTWHVHPCMIMILYHISCSQSHSQLTTQVCLLADSQKQYWEIKQKYRDVMLFFKVGTFYELYEDDAQIGHDVLGWKMTVSGVGHCRQVSPLTCTYCKPFLGTSNKSVTQCCGMKKQKPEMHFDTKRATWFTSSFQRLICHAKTHCAIPSIVQMHMPFECCVLTANNKRFFQKAPWPKRTTSSANLICRLGALKAG